MERPQIVAFGRDAASADATQGNSERQGRQNAEIHHALWNNKELVDADNAVAEWSDESDTYRVSTLKRQAERGESCSG